MTFSTAIPRGVAATAIAGCVVMGLAACGGDGSPAGGNGSTTYTVWDPYPQFDAGAAWSKLLDTCGAAAGATIRRTAFDTTDLTTKALLSAQQGHAPDVLVVDNPVVSTLADAGMLTTTEVSATDTSAISPNLLAAGQQGGKTYGVPIGANTLALYYNKKVLKAAGVDVTSITNWASLTEALAKVKAAGRKGITFSAIGTEEGSFQFLPWFWGGGARLTQLDSPAAVAALSLWTDWVTKGYAPNSVINNTQTTSWQEFETGDFAFAENGTWQLAGVKKSGLDWGVIPVPGVDGGTAPAPTGGEFVTLPIQANTSRYATSQKIISCLTSTDHALATDTTLSYIAATTAVQDQQVAADPDLTVWVEAVKSARGRTSDDLGTKYPKISEQLWKATQAALTRSTSPRAALTTAQSAAASATSGS